MDGELNQGTGASGSGENVTPAQSAEPTTPPQPQPATEFTQDAIPTTAKVEIKDGKVMVDGKPFVAESHLIAAKKSLEGKLNQAQTAHEQAITAAKLEVSQAQQNIAHLNAKLEDAEKARMAGAISDSDVAKVRLELETAKSSAEQLSQKALEYRKQILTMKYGISEDTIKDKDMQGLDFFEEAIKAVATSKGGIGPYATGAGAADAVPKTPMERALKTIENTPYAGVSRSQTG